MAYGKYNHRSTVFYILKIKIARLIISSFPLNAVRIYGLKMCGFKVGKKVYIGSGLVITMFNSKSNCRLEIGDRVAIAPRVTLVLASDANWSALNTILPPVEGRIVLGNDCWLCTGAIILPDVTIGEMSVVGAGSLVNKDVPPYTIVGGIPARELKKIRE